MKRILSSFTVLLLMLVLVACQTGPNQYQVYFYSTSGELIETITIGENQSLEEPENPSRDGYHFKYWYSDDINKSFDFSITISEDVVLTAMWSLVDVVLTNEVEVTFENLTTEFEVENGSINLYYTDNGAVPYVKIVDYISLVKGFIDPSVEFTYTQDDTSLEIHYVYYDEDEDETYDLNSNFNLDTNLITTNDDAFFWAYIYSTKTNYGRNISYLYNHEDNHNVDGETVIYNLNLYNLDLSSVDGDIVAPYYLVNQLFAGSSYYNVYFNGEKMYGLYGQIPSSGADYNKIKRTAKNGTNVPKDLAEHNFDVLAFNLDYFYGLKDYFNVKSYYSLLASFKRKLVSANPETSSQALVDFLLKTIDEPHTSFGFPGYYNTRTYSPETGSLSNYGPRFNDWYQNGLFAVDDVIATKWNITNSTGWAANNSKRPKYWFIDNESAVISFDSFDTSDINETSEWDDTAYSEIFEEEQILPALVGGNRYFVYNQSTNKEKVSETIIWGLDSSSIEDYEQALIDNGFQLIKENTSKIDYHLYGYYQKTINDINYMVTISYDATYSSFYIGLTNQLPSTYDANWLVTGNIKQLVESDSAVYLEKLIQKIKLEKPGIKNIGLDLTFNTGGNIGALYRIVGLLTDKPFAVSSHNRGTRSYSTTHITTTYNSYTEYNWFLLTSKATFSAANELATIFKQNKIGPIIGQTSGGGTSSITPILLPDGSFFTMSSNSMNMIRLDDGEYLTNETGITPDHVIPTIDLYNNSVLQGILNGTN